MKITVLVDNNTFIDQYLIGEPAVSYFIETEGKEILFDVGYSDVFLTNANKLGISLIDLDMIVLSHGHLDHTWGLAHLYQYFTEMRSFRKKKAKPVLIAHPMAFASRSYNNDPEIGSILKPDALSKIFEVQLNAGPQELTQKLLFLGEVERLNNFEAQQNIGMISWDGRKSPDMVLDDTALAYRADEGLVIITGCSHAGICNIIEYARKLTGESNVVDVLGGFHLLNPSESQMQGTLDYFKKLNPGQLHACHCTDLKSKLLLAKISNLMEVGSGLVLEY